MGIYEGLLRGMDDTLASGNVKAAVLAANETGSEFRKMFGVSSYNEEPFSATEENGELVFTINNEGTGVWAECGKGGRLSAISSDITTIKCAGGIRIIAKDDNIADALCKTIIADNISVHQATEVKDVDLLAKNIAPKRIIPNMQFDSSVKKVTNCTLELDYANTTASRIIFYNLPEFDNVRSNSVRYIDITDNPIKFNGVKPQDLFSSPRYQKLFDFGYELSYVDDFGQTPGKVTIKDMKGLRKLVTSKDFYSREFTEWPYRLKPGAKLSDFIDVSQFKGLSSITITDKKMGVLFEKVDNPYGKQHASYVYFTDMLKQTWEEKTGHKRNEIDNLIPVTVDGWRVIIFRR